MKEKIILFIIKHNKTIFIVAATALVAIAATLFLQREKLFGLHIGVDNDTINKTPIVVDKLKQIGEWEFLSIDTEEMVDTVAKKKFLGIVTGDKEYIRIFPGVLRFGVDMKELTDNNIIKKGDTIKVTLPEIKLLSEDFIDETAAKTFYEEGKWEESDRKFLYEKAVRQMRERHVTEANMKKAHDIGVEQMKNLLKSLGVEHYTVE